ncbi:MAG: hypothetical protein ACKO3F_05250 [Cyanobium sp.]
MTDHAPEQDPTIVQSFSSDLETGIRVKNHTQDINDRITNRRIKPILSTALALLSLGGFDIAAYGVIWHSDAKVRETMASNVWTPLSAIAGLLAGMALK